MGDGAWRGSHYAQPEGWQADTLSASPAHLCPIDVPPGAPPLVLPPHLRRPPADPNRPPPAVEAGAPGLRGDRDRQRARTHRRAAGRPGLRPPDAGPPAAGPERPGRAGRSEEVTAGTA